MSGSRDRSKISGVSRRNLLLSTAAFGVGSLASPFVIPTLSQEVLVVNTQGGEYQEIVERTVIKPFEKKFGVKVTHDPTGTAAEDYAKIRASRGAPGFDVAATLTAAEIILARARTCWRSSPSARSRTSSICGTIARH